MEAKVAEVAADAVPSEWRFGYIIRHPGGSAADRGFPAEFEPRRS
jgi:hypothetical protein